MLCFASGAVFRSAVSIWFGRPELMLHRLQQFGLYEFMLCFTLAPSLAVRRPSSIRCSRLDAILRFRGRFYIRLFKLGLHELMLCFASAPSSAVRSSRVDAMLRFRRRLWFGGCVWLHEGPPPSCLLMETTVLCLLPFIFNVIVNIIISMIRVLTVFLFLLYLFPLSTHK